MASKEYYDIAYGLRDLAKELNRSDVIDTIDSEIKKMKFDELGKNVNYSYVSKTSKNKEENKDKYKPSKKKTIFATEKLEDEDVEDVWYNDDCAIDDEDDIENYEEDGFNNELSFNDFLNDAEVLLVDNAFDFDINEWEKENQEEIDEELCDDDWTQEDEEDFNTYDEESITPEQEQFYEEVKDVLQSLIDDEDKEDQNKELDEEFVSNKELKNHFFRHCLANDKSKVSTRNIVYYDFNTIQEYSNYENELNKNFQSNSDTIILSDPYNIEEVNDAFLQLFKNNTYIIFGWEWNLTNNIGIIQLRIHSFASNVTTNYKTNDTLDIMIRTPRNKSITLYAIDLSRMKNKFFNILKKYSNLPLIKSKDNNKLLDSLGEDLEETSPYTNIKSNGIYSLNTGWVKHPVQQDIPDIDMEEFEKEFKVWEDKYFGLLDKESGREEIDNLIEDIYNLRKEGMGEDGEYSIKNLIFKEFRNLGYLDNLKDLRKKEISKELSLESLKEELINYSNEDEINYKTKEIMNVISEELKTPFVKYISLDWLSYGDLIKGYDYRDLVKLVVPYIVFNDTDYNVYFTDKLGWEDDNDYIVTRKETTLKHLYKVFKRDWEEQEETLSKEEFEDHVFTIDENGNYINVKID